MKTQTGLLISKAVSALLIIFFMLNNMYAKAQTTNTLDTDSIAARLVRYEVKPAYQTAFKEAMSDYVLYSLKQQNNILSEAYYEQDNPAVLWIIERWSSKQALEKAIKSNQFQTLKSLYEKALVYREKNFYIKDLEPLSKDEWRTMPKKEDATITIMLFVDSKPGTEDKFKELYHIAMPQFRSEPGVINYQLSQLEDDSTQFVTYEKFRNEDAFQYHLNFPPIQPVIDYLNTSIKKQPFQIGLHKLIAFAPFSYE